jgi:integrase
VICYVYKRKGRRTWRGRYQFTWMSKIKEVPLKTADKQVAQKQLADLIRDVEQEHAGIIAPKPLREAAKTDLARHLEDYIRDLETLGRDDMYVYNVDRLIQKLLTECRWRHPKDVTPDSFQTWRSTQDKAPKTLNEYLATMGAFLNWLVRHGRLTTNPLQHVEQVEMRGRERRKRRASSHAEIARLLAVAGPRSPVYLLALLTGLRRSEIGELVWDDVALDAPRPFLKVRASISKNHLDASIWLHADLVTMLRSLRSPNVAPEALVFPQMPSMYCFKADLAAAGIPYLDAQGRQADFHALRHTFGTNLSLAGVLPRVAMELMRQSDLRLTMKIYTDASCLPAADGIDRLPSFTKTAHK